MSTEDSVTNDSATVPIMLRWSETLGSLATTIGKWATFFMIPMVGITVWDVLQRKIMKFIGDIMLDMEWMTARNWMYDNLLGWLPFQSTLLQELEWHFHVANFALVLGYGYIFNRHVRVDLVREKLSFRKQAWIEFFGVSFFMIPFCLMVAYFSVEYAVNAFETNEQSASLVGLSHRWAIKSILVFGMIIAALAGVAVWLQTAFALFGPRDYAFPHFTIENADEKEEKRKIIETMDATLADGSDEDKRGNSSKLLIRKIDDSTFEHASTTTSQRVFTILGVVVMLTVLALVFHTFNFWNWLI
ncbi:MAG: TRAP transporter small permease subunit [Rhodospirillaceae bacterium]|jgi:TRAP-type mannitol/chloroaromatic compound transport system permease small subunit|nr:TRAP transporter small permease subunit [Rhodospirillaceae bacterium]MBT5665157.1 TRAP transporter small permease subunit [Rhodospirillaceae bacterium]MBT5809891.1 TRAP transporter small permease subunit [Rhodospirillaceae bacterium]